MGLRGPYSNRLLLVRSFGAQRYRLIAK
eukprot:SAG31_NODE_35803_length_319_cov_1.409091_1_plen_27_part_01